MRKLLAALWLGGWLAVLVAGIPYVLLRWFGMPVPRHPPQQLYLREWITFTVMLLPWAIWLLLLVLVGLHLRATVRRVRLRRLRMANPPEGLAAGLLGAAVVAFTTAGSRGTLTTPPAPPVDTVTQPDPAAQMPPAAGQAATYDLAGSTEPGTQSTEPGAHGSAHDPADTGLAHTGLADTGLADTGLEEPTAATTAAASDRMVADRVVADRAAEGADTGTGHGREIGIAGDDGRPGSGGDDDGVALPQGGWISHDLAAAVSAAAGVVWLLRRRRYRPQPPSGSHRQDADLTALPETATAIITALHGGDGTEGDGTEDDRTELDPAGRDRRPAAAESAAGGGAVGQLRQLPLWPADLPAGGVGLTGPGAGDAARGILAAALLSGGTAHPGLVSQVVATAADLTVLLGGEPLRDGHPAGLTVHASVGDLVEAVEEQVLRRAQTTAPPVDGPGGAAPTTPVGDPFAPPLLVLIASPLDAGQARRLAVLLTHSGGRLKITGVLLGAWPYGTTWWVDSDGTIRPEPADHTTGRQPGRVPMGVGRRLCVLPAAAAVDLIMLQAHSRPDIHEYDRPRGSSPPAARPAAITSGASVTRVDEDHRHSRASGARADQVTTAGAWADGATVEGAAAPAGRMMGDGGREARLRLRLLGPIALHRTHVPQGALRLGRRAALQVLVFLALHPAGATSQQLAAALWPGVRPRPTDRVYTAASTLRTAITRATGLQILIREGERYRLNSHHLEVDLWALHTGVEHAAIAHDPTVRAAALATIIRLYAGELAAGQPWPWLDPFREATRRHVIDAYAALAEAADPSTAIGLLEAALRIDPVNEDLHHRAAHAYAAAGQPARASALLTDYTRRLARAGEQPNTRWLRS